VAPQRNRRQAGRHFSNGRIYLQYLRFAKDLLAVEGATSDRRFYMKRDTYEKNGARGSRFSRLF
jgi:hypothetical protein